MLTPAEVWQLASDIQDMHHYAALITKKAWSTFEGDGYYDRGLYGRCLAYEQLLKRLHNWNREEVPAFYNLEMPQYPESSEVMRVEAERAFDLIQMAAQREHIDPNSGELINGL